MYKAICVPEVLNINKIKYIVISHEHWDHTGGLWWVLKNNSNLTVYICKKFVCKQPTNNITKMLDLLKDDKD